MRCDCGQDTIRGIFQDGKWKCPACHPEDFNDKLPKTPIEKNWYLEWEARPNMYKKREGKDGPVYVASDSLKAEWEAKIAKRPDGEVKRENEALAKRRSEVRKKKLSPLETEIALRNAQRIAEEIQKQRRIQESGLII